MRLLTLYLILSFLLNVYLDEKSFAANGQQELYNFKLVAPSEPYQLAYDQPANRYLVLERDSFFYLKNDHKGWVKKSYDKNEFDRNIDFRELVVLPTKTHMFLVLRSGGYVYEMVRDSIRKLDKSSNFNTQYGSVKFVMNDTIMSYGGYGHWSLQPFFTYFDPATGGWEMWELASEETLPIARTRPLGYFNAEQREFYLLGGFTTRYKARLPRQDIQMDDVWKINMTERKWEKLGHVEKDLAGLYLSPLIFKNQVLCYDVEKDRTYHLFNFEQNKLSNYELTEANSVNFYNKITPAVDTAHQDFMYSTLPFPHSSAVQSILISPISNLISGEPVITHIYSNSWISWGLWSLLLFVLIGGWLANRFYNSYSRQGDRIDFYKINSALKFKKIEIQLDSNEQYCLNRLSDDLKYHSLLELFAGHDLEKSSMDVIYKNWKKTFSSINDKVNFVTKGEIEIILARKNPSDSRLLEVKINEEFVKIHH